MTKKAYFYIDDTIWVMRDLTRLRPASMFDNPVLKVLKEAHDRYGLKVQLNLFYRTDTFYGYDAFSLADMTDAYKPEWEAASDWLRLAFHAMEEFPDYPHVNASYQDTKDLFEAIRKEVYRFAGEKSFSLVVCPHWTPVSKAGCQALYDCGVQLLDTTQGERFAYNGDPFSLPYGHAARLLQNRQPESGLYRRETKDVAIANSLSSYNHLEEETQHSLKTIRDKEIGILFKTFCSFCLNHTRLTDIVPELEKLAEDAYIGICDHEQYLYPDYYAYQPDQPEKIMTMSKFLTEKGFTFVNGEDIL